MSQKRNRTGSRRPPAPRQEVRAQKRAQFEGPRRRTTMHIVLALLALLAVAVVAVIVVVGGGGQESAPATTTQAAPSGDVSIPVSEVSDGKAHFYSYETGGVEVKYFVLKSSDGKLRAAFDACDVCFQFKKGYHQEGDEMVCNNCGRRFPSVKINVLEGGCNPSPLDRTVKGKDLILNTDDLQAGAQYFL